jgi:hypothetical protein
MQKPRFITVGAVLNFMQTQGILTPEEYTTAIKTGMLPDDILIRLKRRSWIEKN